MTTLAELKPQQNQRVIDLVREAGIDVSDWSNFKGGSRRAASNPRYCYEWSFIGQRIVVLNLWFKNLRERRGVIYSEQSGSSRVRTPATSISEIIWRRRAKGFDAAIHAAYVGGLPLRIIVCDGDMRDAGSVDLRPSRVSKRLLDKTKWAVVSFDAKSGICRLVRGAASVPAKAELAVADPELSSFEGQARMKFMVHRRREARLREAKLQQVRQQNGGRLACQVPNCGFDFAEKYGVIGQHYAHVHHLVPLRLASAKGRRVSLSELAVVCANCHSMIHVGGQCRPLQGLIKRSVGRTSTGPKPRRDVQGNDRKR